ncbi:LamG domain-containing protein [Parapedobacter sp. SGR-10]|uniref:LamG domain-containing protein n=1 Tax=Parapedobacter sp. SGR-10 TaxID=2710879 RepID=UPI0013D5A85A|nr:LamG domain-containing protein [Parapedobacter sp. SGR-10]NGF57722.1 LamG domain-containing protein [Parapedobacter sp. SGR-10]
MKKNRLLSRIVVCVAICLGSCGKSGSELRAEDKQGEEEHTEETSSVVVPQEGLIAWYPLDGGDSKDHTTNGNHGVSHHVTAASNRHGVYGLATRFNGENSYIDIQHKDYLSIATTGEFTVSVWMRIETLNFSRTQTSEPYVHWMGKGRSGKHEYVFRIYNKDSYRPNRISGYAFNLSGGLGSGASFQHALSIGEWIHICIVYDFANNTIKIYRDGTHRNTGHFTDYEVIPQMGDAPLCIGTRDFASFFKGVLDDLRIYNRALTDEEVQQLSQE